MIKRAKKILRKTFNFFGWDFVKKEQNPAYTLLGLRYLPIRSIIDVGANEGQFAKSTVNIFPEARLICFEPLPDPFKKLSGWAENLNQRVELFNIALGEDEGNVIMFNHLEHSPSSSLLIATKTHEALYPFTKKKTSVSVELATLDKIIANLEEPLVPDILIKLDVQGYEDRVIKGGYKTFHNAKACILEICLDELYKDQASLERLFTLLWNLGFRYIGNLSQALANDDGHVIFIDAVFLRNER